MTKNSGKAKLFMKGKLRVLLGIAPTDLNFTGTEDFALPLGLASIATYLGNAMGRKLEIKLLNGVWLKQKDFVKEVKAFNPQIAGFQSTIGSHAGTLAAAQAAKNLGAFVVFGGVNATFLYKEILQNREFVDGVVLHEAELPFQKLVQRLLSKKPLDNVPNLVYKKKSKTVLPKTMVIHNLDLLPNINYGFFDLEKHFEKSTKAGLGRAVNYYSGRGCARRAASSLVVQKNTDHLFVPFKQFENTINSMKSCSFCGRMDLGNRSVADKKTKQLLDWLYFEKGVRFFWDVWDTYCAKDGQKMFNGNETFRFFARISDINKNYIGILKKRFGKNINLQIGLESGSQETFDRMGKNIPLKIEQMFWKLEFLKKQSITIDPGFVLGIEGETEKTLEETKDFIARITALGNTRWVLASPLTLLPGSQFYKKFLSCPETQKKYSCEDQLDAVKMNAEYLSLFAKVSREDVIETLKEIKSSLPEKVKFGCKGISKKEGRHIGIKNQN